MANFLVSTLNDDVFGGGDFDTETADGGGLSLREALALANGDPDMDVISFDPSLGGGTLLLTNGSLEISTDVVVSGFTDCGCDNTPDITISGGGATNVLHAVSGMSVVYGLNIIGGAGQGGGLYVNSGASIYVGDTVISGTAGDAIFNAGTLALASVKLVDNDGRGLANVGDATLIDTTVAGNSAAGNGGGIFNNSNSVLTLVNSTVANNTATGNGGGLFVAGDGTATLTNVTVSGNRSGGPYGGGGIYADGTLTLSQVTISGNQAAASGGGLYFYGAHGSLTVSNSIILGNADGAASDDLFYYDSDVTEFTGTSIIGTGSDTDASDHVIQAAALTDVFADVSANPATGVQSGTLADNSGPVETIAINPDGIARNSGDNAALPADIYDIDRDSDTSEPLPVDARGLMRDAGGTTDIGAYEQQDPVNLVVTTLNDDEYDGGGYAAELADGGGLSLREALSLANGNGDLDRITFDGSLSGGTLMLSGAPLTVYGSVIIDGDIDQDHFSDITIDAGGSAPIFQIASGSSQLNGLTMAHGGGAGVVVGPYATLTVTDSAVTGSLGPGIYNAGILALSNSTISGNTRGGIYNTGTAFVINSTIAENSSASTGGGIFSDSNSMLILTNSTVANNTADGDGGGLFLAGNSTAMLTNATISGNSSAGVYGGGGIYANGNLTLSQVTISGNHAASDGGGLYFYGAAGSLTIANSIILGNAADGASNDLFYFDGDVVEFTGTSIIGTGIDTDASDHVIQAAALTDVFADVGANPTTEVQSGTLANNGGPVQTIAIDPNGIAHDAGDNAALPSDFTDLDHDFITAEPLPVDARGFNRIDGPSVDVGALEVPCYCPGTLILTDRGEVPVEALRIGDVLATASGAMRPVKWIGRRSYAGRFAFGQKHILPVCIKAGALDEGVPRRDLWISPHHAMYLQGVLIEARDLVNGVSVVQAERVEKIEYFHIELDSHDVIVAEGSLSETFIDDDSRNMFHNAHEYRALYGHTEQEPRYCAPRLSGGYEVETARRTIAGRCGLAAAAERTGAMHGNLDAAGPEEIVGWAQNIEHPEAPVCLDIRIGGRLIAQVLANAYRPDLQDAGIGSGCHSFRYRLPAGVSGDAGEIEVSRSLDGAPLVGTPATPAKRRRPAKLSSPQCLKTRPRKVAGARR